MKTKWFQSWIKSSGASVYVAAVLSSGWLITEAPADNNYTNVVLADNPASYWRLGEANTGMTLVDLTTSNNGTYVASATLGLSGAIADDPDTAARPTLSSGIGTVLNAASLNPTNMTLEMWLTADSVPVQYSSPLIKSDSGWNAGYGLYFDSGLYFFMGFYATDRVGVAFGTNSAYQHVVATYNGTVLALYTNGVLANAVNQTAGSGSSQPLTIGGGAGAELWPGKVDEVAIYGYALSPAQVLNHYNAGISQTAIPEPSSLVLLLAVGLGLRWRQRITHPALAKMSMKQIEKNI